MSLTKLAPPIAVMLIVMVVATIIHGRLTDRFGMTTSDTLIAYTGRLDEIPVEFGPWDGIDTQIDQEQLERAQVTGHISRRFRHRESGAMVDMFLVCGTSRHITLHTPDKCYTAAGFDMEGTPTARDVEAGIGEPVEFAVGRFYKEEAGSIDHLEIMWSFSSDGVWHGPRWARTSLAGKDAIYKIYLIGAISPRASMDSSQQPTVDFASTAMPTIQSVLFPDAELKDG